jgi:hypothetical protein
VPDEGLVLGHDPFVDEGGVEPWKIESGESLHELQSTHHDERRAIRAQIGFQKSDQHVAPILVGFG